MTVAIWLLAYLGVAFLIGRLYAAFLGWGAVRTLFYPGMLVAALGRSGVCVLTGRKTKEIDTVRKDGPVGAQTPPGGLAFRAFFAVAPFLMSVLVFVLVDRLLDHPIGFRSRLPAIELEPQAGSTFLDVAIDCIKGYAHAIGGHELGDVKMWLYLYAAFALVIGSAPSADDAKAVAIALGTLFLVALGFGAIGLRFIISSFYGGDVWRAFSTLFGLSLFVLVASGALFLPIKFLRDARKKEEK